MEFPKPQKNQFTVYSKSGCPNCSKVKQLLKDKNILVSVIDCDDFIFDYKEEFLAFIKDNAGKECKIFPMVFDSDNFIGGFLETKTYLDEKFLNFDLTF